MDSVDHLISYLSSQAHQLSPKYGSNGGYFIYRHERASATLASTWREWVSLHLDHGPRYALRLYNGFRVTYRVSRHQSTAMRSRTLQTAEATTIHLLKPEPCAQDKLAHGLDKCWFNKTTSLPTTLSIHATYCPVVALLT